MSSRGAPRHRPDLPRSRRRCSRSARRGPLTCSHARPAAVLVCSIFRTPAYGMPVSRPACSACAILRHHPMTSARKHASGEPSRAPCHAGRLRSRATASQAPRRPPTISSRFDREHGGSAARRIFFRTPTPSLLLRAALGVATRGPQLPPHAAQGRGGSHQVVGGFSRTASTPIGDPASEDALHTDVCAPVRRLGHHPDRSSSAFARKRGVDHARDAIALRGFTILSSLDADSGRGASTTWGSRSALPAQARDFALAKPVFVSLNRGRISEPPLAWLWRRPEKSPPARPDRGRAGAPHSRAKSHRAREKRVRPGRDYQILASWNALMISECPCRAHFGRKAWLASARARSTSCAASCGRRQALATARTGPRTDAYSTTTLPLAAFSNARPILTRATEWAKDLGAVLRAVSLSRCRRLPYFTSHDHEPSSTSQARSATRPRPGNAVAALRSSADLPHGGNAPVGDRRWTIAFSGLRWRGSAPSARPFGPRSALTPARTIIVPGRTTLLGHGTSHRLRVRPTSLALSVPSAAPLPAPCRSRCHEVNMGCEGVACACRLRFDEQRNAALPESRFHGPAPLPGHPRRTLPSRTTLHLRRLDRRPRQRRARQETPATRPRSTMGRPRSRMAQLPRQRNAERCWSTREKAGWGVLDSCRFRRTRR